MKHYPSIDHASRAPRQSCYAFVKYDGSNIRAEWSKKRGWYKFGTRKLLFDETSDIFGPAIGCFLNKYGDDLSKAFRHKDFRGVDGFIVFFEWFGARSFAGAHEPDDPKDVVLFDVNPHRKGMLGPKQFLDYFGHLKVAEHIWTGNLGPQVLDAVRAMDFDFIDYRSSYDIKPEVPEGVVFKGGSGHGLWMAKAKSQAWYDAIKTRRPQDWEKLLQEDFPE